MPRAEPLTCCYICGGPFLNPRNYTLCGKDECKREATRQENQRNQARRMGQDVPALHAHVGKRKAKRVVTFRCVREHEFYRPGHDYEPLRVREDLRNKELKLSRDYFRPIYAEG
jgi:hypothetical protein